MPKIINHVGIDVGSKEIVCAIRNGATDDTKTKVFENSATGHKKLLKHITKNKATAMVCLEATGVYHFELSLFLSKSSNAKVMVINPKAMHHFATATLQRAKTDRYDACVILEYLTRMNFVEWKAPHQDELILHRLSRRIAQLKKIMTQEDARLAASKYLGKNAKPISDSIKKTVDGLKKQIKLLQDQILKIIKNNKNLSLMMQRLISVKGIADVSAIQIIAELVMLPDGLKAEQWVAFSGLDPKPFESGTSIKRPQRISKHGNKYLRSALYMPALVAIRFDPNVKAYYEKLLGKGKAKMQAIIAVMRKMLLSIWGIVHTGENWNGDKFYKLANLA